MNDTLGYNVENLRSLASELGSQLSSFESNIAQMYNVIDVTLNSSSYWQGQTYDQFKSYCDNYRRTEIEPLIEQIKTWVQDIERVADSAEATTSKNTSLFS